MTYRRSTALATLLGLLVTLLFGLAASPAQATFPGRNGLILFNRGGNLFTATATGGSIRQLTTSGGISGGKWSPDGKRIAFRVGTKVMVRTQATGRTVAVGAGAATAPVWAPNGRTVAFVAGLPGAPCGEQGVFSVPAAGGAAARLIWDPQSDNCPHASDVWGLGGYTHDGSGLLVTGCNAYRDDICGITERTLDPLSPSGGAVRGVLSIACFEDSVFPPDGSAALCGYGLHLSDPRVGPGGNGILFTGKGGLEKPTTATSRLAGTLPGSTPFPTSSTPEHVYVVDRSGTGLHRVSTATSGINPTWSPKGDQVLFTQRTGTTNNIMRVVGTSASATATLLIRNASQADWQPLV